MARPHERNRGCVRTVFIVGNDGAGKTTFTSKLTKRAEAGGLRVSQRRYYGSWVRILFRQVIEALTGASRQKTAAPRDGTPHTDPQTGSRLGLRRATLLGFLWAYQTGIGLETRVRDLIGRGELLIVDRSFVDDLISIGQTLRLEIPPSLLRYSCWLFPIRRLYFLSAGDSVEFARITDVDLTEEFHKAKGANYRQTIAQIEPWIPGVRRISTVPRRRRP